MFLVTRIEISQIFKQKKKKEEEMIESVTHIVRSKDDDIFAVT